MIAILRKGTPVSDKAEIVRFLEREGFRIQVGETDDGSYVSIIGEGAETVADRLRAMPGVVELQPVAPTYPLVSRSGRPRGTRVKIEDVVVGSEELIVMAGPCAVESRDQILGVAEKVAAAGARMLRGGAFKPRTSPYSFRGLGVPGLELLAEAGAATGLRVVTEVLAPEDVSAVGRHADLLQIGARNMQNYRLLSAVGEQPRPVLLKRGMMATVEELLLAAEYVVSAGNPRVILCERGIRTFEQATRNTLDLCAIPVLREKTHLPVIVDPSHAAGRRELVPALARAAIAAGCDGLIVEVHTDPERAVSDGRQSLTPDGFGKMMDEASRVAAAVGRRIGPGP